MDKLIKFFPFMPEEKDSTRLVIAILFYVIVPPIVYISLGAILGFTIILLPLSPLVGMLGSAYQILGIVFTILRYTGHESVSNK